MSATSRWAAATAGMRNDPAVAAAVFVLWALLALFVVYPLAMLLVRVLTDQGGFTTAVMSVCQPDHGVTIIAVRFSLAVRFLATE